MSTAATEFTEHTYESAPAEAVAVLRRTARPDGSLLPAVARLAESPETLNAFLELSARFERTGLPPTARETVIMAVAVRNSCGICVDMHTARLRALGPDEEFVAASVEQRPLPDEPLEALRQFTLAVLDGAGRVTDEQLAAFLAHGWTRRNALEVVLGIGAYTLSTFANRLTRAPR